MHDRWLCTYRRFSPLPQHYAERKRRNEDPGICNPIRLYRQLHGICNDHHCASGASDDHLGCYGDRSDEQFYRSEQRECHGIFVLSAGFGELDCCFHSKGSINTFTAGVFAKYVADSTSATYGSIDTGNTVTNTGVGTYDVTATCGSVVSNQMRLTVTAGVPTITSASPNVCAPTSCSMTLTGSNYSAANANSITDWQGTLIASSLGSCPAGGPSGYAGNVWKSPTQVGYGYTSSGASLGSWNITVKNKPTSLGTDGGSNCKENVYTITATGMAVSGGTVANANPETGVLTVSTDHAAAATFNLGFGASTPRITDNAVYVMQPSQNAIARIDLQSLNLTSISLGAYVPIGLVKDSGGQVIALTQLASDHSKGALIGVSGGFASQLMAANGFTAVTAFGTDIVGVEPSEDGQTTTVHIYSQHSAAESTFTLNRKVDTVAAFSSGVIAYKGGATEASVLDLNSRKESGTASFYDGILAVSGDRVALFDGSIGDVALTTDGSGAPKLSWTLFSKQAVEDLYAGFAISAADGAQTLLVSHRSPQGALLPKRATVNAKQ